MKTLKLIPLCFALMMFALVSCEKDAPIVTNQNNVEFQQKKSKGSSTSSNCNIIINDISTNVMEISANLDLSGICPASIMPLTVQLVTESGVVQQSIITNSFGYVQFEAYDCNYYLIRVTTNDGDVFETALYNLQYANPFWC